MAATQLVYEEYHPDFSWKTTEDKSTLILDLPKFSKHNLKVIVTSDKKLVVHGVRQEQGNKWVRFMEQYNLPSDTSIKEIKAKFESEKLYITLTKAITPLDAPKEEEKDEAEAAGTGNREAGKADDVSGKAKDTERDGVSETDRKMERKTGRNGGGREVLEKYYKQGAGYLIEQMRRPGMLVKLSAILLVMALCLCMRNAMSSCKCK